MSHKGSLRWCRRTRIIEKIIGKSKFILKNNGILVMEIGLGNIKKFLNN